MFKEFKNFIAKGNVMDLAVGVIIGGAFGAIVKSLTDDVLMPIIGAIFGGLDFSNYFIPLAGQTANTLAEAKKGGAVFALNMSLNEELTISDGRIVEGNFNAYPMLRIGDMPAKINVHFEALSGHDRFGIIGESPMGPVGPAVANAIFSAIGKRIRTMPFRHHDLSWAA